MSLSVSGSNTSLAAQLLKSLRDAAATDTAAGSTTAPASTTTGATHDGSAAPSSAMMAFLARLSGSVTLGRDDAGEADSTNEAATSPVTQSQGGHRHRGGAHVAATDAGTTASPASVSDATDLSTLVATFTEALQSPTPSAGTSGASSLAASAISPLGSVPSAVSGPDRAAGTSASVATDTQMRAFMRAMRAYADQGTGGGNA